MKEKTVYVVLRTSGNKEIEHFGIFSTYEKALDFKKKHISGKDFCIVDVALDREVEF